MRMYLDSSALVKRHIVEQGTKEVVALCSQATMLGVSVICLPECVSALCRRKREGTLDTECYERVKEAVVADIDSATVCDLTPAAIGRAIELMEGNTLRAMDALQVACAVEWNADLFVSADRRQLAAAESARLTTVAV